MNQQEGSMGISVRIPTPLRSLTRNQAEVLAEGKTIKEVIENLETAYSGIKERICDEEGNLRRFVNLYLNDEDIRFLEDLQTEVHEGDGLSIVPAIAGG
jgi:molybdopterin synthase sulfur carrier subunit